MQFLTADNQQVLEAQGFGIAELTGFEEHSIPLYAHRTMGDRSAGDVVMRARVGNPASLDDGEATYLARKAHHGMFPWQPGKECRAREFIEIEVSKRDGSVKKGAPRKGCRWCRIKRPAARRTVTRRATESE